MLERDWNRYLEDVARANKLICNIDLVTDNSLTTAERAQYKAEAKIFRAMVMFDMVRLWGDFPVITTVADDITSENIDEVYPQYFPKQKDCHSMLCPDRLHHKTFLLFWNTFVIALYDSIHWNKIDNCIQIQD